MTPDTSPIQYPRILVVDDNEAIHEDFKKALNPTFDLDPSFDNAEDTFFGKAPSAAPPSATPRYQLESAYQGEEALAKVCAASSEGHPYSMAFLDVRMPPGWDGVETAARIWKEHPELHIVICTAHSDYSWDEMLRILDSPDKLLILKKPFERIEVQQIAHTITEKHRLNQANKLHVDTLEAEVEERTRWLEAANDELKQEMDARHQAQEERERINQQLQQAQKLESIGQLAAGIAHEINTPMQYIGDNVQFIQSSFTRILQALEAGSQLDPSDKKKLDRVLGQIPSALDESLVGIQRVTQIVQAMKLFARVGTQDKAEADLRQSIESTLTVSQSEWKLVADTLIQIDPELPPIPCYVGELNQVFLNLIVNAAHAIGDALKGRPGEKGLITIAAKEIDRWAEIRISDTGGGIPPAVQPRIFEPFFTTKEVGKGTGQGLSMAYATIVKKHTGDLLFETTPGKGTTFIIRLPLEHERS